MLVLAQHFTEVVNLRCTGLMGCGIFLDTTGAEDEIEKNGHIGKEKKGP